MILSIRQPEGPAGPPAGLLKASVSAAIACLLVAASGCGGAEGVASGATVNVYVVPPLCAEAESELERQKGRAGDLRVQAVCLPSGKRRGKLELATVGANARRATEDSTSVAYLEAPGRGNRFSEPILESAEIPSIHDSSGRAAMARLLRAIERAGSSSSLRASVSKGLE